MASKIFVNLPVNDLNKTKVFFEALGYRFNPQFTDENAACMIIREDIMIMLLVKPFFKSFIDKEIVNAHESTEVLLGLSFDSRIEVDDIINKAVAAGGTEINAAKDHGFMYTRTFNDLDGHIWEVFWMDLGSIQ